MKKTTTFFLLWLPIFAFGQAHKKVTNKLPGGPLAKEVYEVLKSDPTVKDGSYARYRSAGLAEKGAYANNQKVGIWEYYDPEGEVVQRYNVTSAKLEFARPTSFDERTRVLKDGKVSDQKPDEMPAFLGGEPAIMAHYLEKIRYPAEALQNQIAGEVLIGATVTTDGKIIDEAVEKGLGYGLSEESLRVVQLLPDNWIPGKVNGVPVDTHVVLAVKYTIL